MRAIRVQKTIRAPYQVATVVIGLLVGTSALLILSSPVGADPFFFSTGNPDGLIGTLSVPPSPGQIETETADDFTLTQPTRINQATFTGLLPAGVPLSSVQNVEVELYHVFPADSANPPSGHVPTRVNSPGDVQFAAFDKSAGTLSVTTTLLNSSFTVANTVVNGGIHPSPNQFTGGQGPATGQEVQFNITFNPAVTLPADHYFFRPEVQLASGSFLWLSAPRPIVAPGTPFTGDLQSWTRNADLAPDWLRIGTDITGQGPFNATFSLSGTTIPEPSTWLLLGSGLVGLAWRRSRMRTGHSVKGAPDMTNHTE